MSLFSTTDTLPFAIALALLIFLAIIEVLGLLFASSPSHWLDSIMPHADLDGPNALDWLHVGKVPVLVLLILLLTGFSLSGYAIQMTVQTVLGHTLPAWLVCIPAVFLGLTNASLFGGIVARLIPSDETSAVSEQSLMGQTAVIIQGLARRGAAAQAKVVDQHGHAHYVLVEPEADDESFNEGETVLLLSKKGVHFRCIRFIY